MRRPVNKFDKNVYFPNSTKDSKYNLRLIALSIYYWVRETISGSKFSFYFRLDTLCLSTKHVKSKKNPSIFGTVRDTFLQNTLKLCSESQILNLKDHI